MTVRGQAVFTLAYWAVVMPEHGKRGKYVVLDTSVKPPVQVYGPTTRADAEAYARVQAGLFSAVYGQSFP